MATPRYLTRQLAAEYLTALGISSTATRLADYAHDGSGPPYTIINGRALYTREELDAWVAERAARGRVAGQAPRRPRRQPAKPEPAAA